MRILIAGGSGYLGSHLAVHLSSKGHEVILGLRNSKKSPHWLPGVRVEELVWGDIKSLAKSCKDVDIVIQAAGMNAEDSMRDPVGALEFNARATSRLLESAQVQGVQRFIYLSTAHVYGSPLVGNLNEESATLNQHPYATSHLAGEAFIRSACESGGTKGIVLRLSNVYGAPIDVQTNCWMLLVNDICRQIIERGSITLNSDGSQVRDFIPMEIFTKIAEEILTADIKKFEIFNVGSEASMTIMRMTELVQARCKILLGFIPVVNSKPYESKKNIENLTYECSKLKDINILFEDCRISEIDNLITYCKEQFS